jgi:hypothetical protein
MGDPRVASVGETVPGFMYYGGTEVPASNARAIEVAEHIIVNNDNVKITVCLTGESLEHGPEMGAAATRGNHDGDRISHTREPE